MLRALMLNKKIREKQVLLDAVREKLAGYKVRESELKTAIEEASTDEEMQAVDEEIAKLDADITAADEEAGKLEEEIRGLEEELEEVKRSGEKASGSTTKVDDVKNVRTGGNVTMIKRGIFAGKTVEERAAFFAREDVKGFAERVRELAAQKRGVTGAELNLSLIHI